MEIAESERGLNLALEWVKKKFSNHIEFLKRLRKTRPHKSAEITSYIEKLENTANKLNSLSGNIDENRGSIMGIEGSGGRIYFESLSSIMPDRFKFNKFNTLRSLPQGSSLKTVHSSPSEFWRYAPEYLLLF